MGAAAIFLLLLIVIVAIGAAVFFSGGLGALQGRRQGQVGDAGMGAEGSGGSGGRRRVHDAPHPEQAERERGTLFPPGGAR